MNFFLYKFAYLNVFYPNGYLFYVVTVTVFILLYNSNCIYFLGNFY